jgi:hypothetical protein
LLIGITSWHLIELLIRAAYDYLLASKQYLDKANSGTS